MIDFRAALLQRNISPAALRLTRDTVQALTDAEMYQTLQALRRFVFGSGRALEQRDGPKLDLTPFAELLLVELRALADSGIPKPNKDDRGLSMVVLAGW